MADVFQRKTSELAAALQHDDEEERSSARQALRGFIDHIVIPAEGLLQVVGNFGEMLKAAGGRAGAAAVAYVGCGGVQPSVLAAVAGGGVTLPIGLPKTTVASFSRG
jgi:hypothetical protein